MRRLILFFALALCLFAQPLAFVDRYQSTLASGCTSPCTSLSVSSATGLPSGTTYLFAIVRAEGANTEEVFKVTSVSGTTLTVTGAQAGTSASSHGAGAIIVASIMTKTAFTQMESDSQSVTISNAASTGTTLNKLAKLTGAPSTAVITGTSDTSGAIGIVTAGAGTSGSALVQYGGSVSCVFDGATTAGDYVQISSSTAGDCHDTGASTYPTSGQVIGRVLSTNGGGGTYSMYLFPPEIKAGAGSGGGSLIDTYSNIAAATCGSAQNGEVGIATDAPLFASCNGSAWSWVWPGVGSVTKPKAVSNFTTVNFSGTTLLDDIPGGTYMFAPASGSNNIRFAYLTAGYPSTPFTKTICMSPTEHSYNFWSNGIGVSDGTKFVLFVLGFDNDTKLLVYYFTNSGTFSSIKASAQPLMPDFAPVCLSLTDNGTNFIFKASMNLANTEQITVATVSRTDFLTPSQIGYIVNESSSTGSGMRIYSSDF